MDAVRLSSLSNARSKTARLRDIYDEVEMALSKGVKHQQMVDVLNETGLELTLKTFESLRFRIAQERKARSAAKMDTTAKAASSSCSQFERGTCFSEQLSDRLEIASNKIGLPVSEIMNIAIDKYLRGLGI